MNRHTSAAALLAALALSIPMVSHAQDPATVYKQVQALSAQGKRADAVQLCDQVLKAFGSGKSRLSAQFGYMMPYFYWQKASLLAESKDFKGAYETFKALHDSDKYNNKQMIAQSAQATGTEEGYAPFLTASLFQMGYCRFQEALGSEAAPGDKKLFEEAIPLLEEYLKLYQSGKVSKSETKQKLDGKICFLLMQASLLKEQPDFKQAEHYLVLSGKCKEKLPDDMAMTGLATIVQVAMQKPEYIDWVARVISSNPSSFKMSADRAARHATKFLNPGIKAVGTSAAALKKDDQELAIKGAQAAVQLFGMLPEVRDVRVALAKNIKMLGKYEQAVPDPATGASLVLREQKSLFKNYSDLAKNHTEIEAFAILTMANNALAFGSNRLGKAGYQLINDRYPKLQQPKGKDKFESMSDKNMFQLAQLCRVTGDDEAATKLEQKLEKSGSDVGSKNIKLNNMARLVKQQDWANVIPAADEVMEMYKGEPTGQAYLSGAFSKVAALYKLQKYADVAEQGAALLGSGNLKATKAKGGLNEKQATTYSSQCNFFVIDAYDRLGKVDPANYDKALEYFDLFVKNHPSLDAKENPLASNAYYTAIDTLLHRQGHGDEAAKEKDMEKALEYCKVIADNWPGSAVFPTSQLLRGNILINGDDESRKLEGIEALESCTEGALKQPDGKGKGTAANALYWLASYAPELPREGEDQAAVDARVKGYCDRFWSDADQEGNPYALQMSTLELKRAARGKDAAAYNAALKRTQEIITRESNFAFNAGKVNDDLEAAINDYVAAYVDGNKLHNGKEFTLEEKAQHFNNFPGINPEDKYTRAILRMAMISSMNEAMNAIKDDADKRTALANDIEKTFRDMTNTFKPADLTSFICVQVGKYLVQYVSRFENPSTRKEELAEAEAYFGEVVNRNQDQVEAARLGLADARALTGDAAKQAEALKEYDALAQSKDRAVSGPALMGAAKLYMAMGNAAKAVETAKAFVDDRGNANGRLDMLMLLGEAYDKAGDPDKSLLTYMNLYNQNLGNVTYSAPACLAMCEVMWKRNKGEEGDRLKGTFKQSDHWQAWNTAKDYVGKLRAAGFEQKMTRAENDLFQKVVQAEARYGADPGVQNEDKARREFAQRVKSSKKK